MLLALRADPVASAALTRLEQQQPGTSLYELADDTRIVAQYIVTTLPIANLVGTRGDIQVAVSFRRPGTGTFDPLLGPSGGPVTAYKAADPARANAVWAAIDAGEPVNRNIFTMSQREKRRLKIGELPHNLSDALDNLERDQVVLDALGGHIAEHYLEAKRLEWAAYLSHVHPWEQERYLHEY